MKKTFLLLALGLTAACAGPDRNVYILPETTENKTIEDKDEIKVYYTQEYYNSAIEINADNAAEKLGNKKLPTPVLVSDNVIDTIDYQQRISVGNIHGINWLGKEYKGAYLINGKNMIVLKFPMGSNDFSNGHNFMKNAGVHKLFCIAKPAEQDDRKLMMQDMIYLATPNSKGEKTKLGSILESKIKNEKGEKVYIHLTDCAYVKFEEPAKK